MYVAWSNSRGQFKVRGDVGILSRNSELKKCPSRRYESTTLQTLVVAVKTWCCNYDLMLFHKTEGCYKLKKAFLKPEQI